MMPSNSDYFKSDEHKAIETKLAELWKEHREAQKTHPEDAPRIRHEIGLLHGRIYMRTHPDESTDWWCIWCERVSVQSVPLYEFPGCRYQDCDPMARICELLQAREDFGDLSASYRHNHGSLWKVIREKHCPDYPEVAEVGMRYPVPGMEVNLQRDTWKFDPKD